MTLRKIALFAVGLPLMAGFFACNDSAYEYSVMTSSSAAVKSFSLTADDSVLANLDSVYFSIDLVNGLIFNADSLPVGTDVTHLIPKITTLETASAVELKVKRSNGTDTTYNYLDNTTDSIDFTNPVTLRVLSYDGLNEFNYTVKVNVHKMVVDSLTWNENYRSTLPASITPVAQRTAKMNDTYYCLTTDGTRFCMASCTPSSTPTNSAIMLPSDWSTEDVSFPFTPKMETFAATDEALFILSDDGTLYTSADAKTWTATDKKWHSVYGRYADQILGSVETVYGWMVESYPSGAQYPVLPGMPVEGASMPISYSFQMSSSEQMVVLGGRDANGGLSASAWGFDGKTWVKQSRRTLPTALEGIAVASYFSFITSSSWNVKTYPTLVAFGGRDENGKVSTKVYMSNDYGVNWQEAPTEMQLPDYIPAMYGAQTFVTDSYYSTNIKPLIVKPTETWPCPYIYMYGGYSEDGVFQNTIWRGVINRLSFVPIE